MENTIEHSDTDSDSTDDFPSIKRQKIERPATVEKPTGKFSRNENLPPDIEIPTPGMEVDRKQFRKAGCYTIGTEVVGYRPVRSIVHYIGKKDNTNQFYQLKILQLSQPDSQDEQRGKMLLHTEYSLLSLLQNEEGIIKQHGMFSDLAYEETQSRKRKPMYTGAVIKRLVLVLDCLIQHPFCDKSSSYISLQEHIMTMKKFSESEALYIFHEIVKIVERIHKRNVIHRDLKLGNIVLNRTSKKVIITNFCLGRYLSNESTLLYDQAGSPAYVSPDVLSGKPYKGKPSDMWALGVVFFIMLFGNFPFFNSICTALFAQIQSGEFEIPQDATVSRNSVEIIKGLLNVDPEKRLTASQLRQKLESSLAMKKIVTDDQCVPYHESKYKFLITFKNTILPLGDQIVPTFNPNDEQTVPVPAVPTSTNSSVIAKLTQNMLKTLRQATKQSLSAVNPTTMHGSRLFASNLDRFNLAQRIRGRSGNVSTSTPISNSGSITARSDLQTSMRCFITLLDQYFISGRILAPTNRPLQEFNGILSLTMAQRLHRWISNEFGENGFVRHCFRQTSESVVTKIKNLLSNCGVRIEITIFGPRISRNQSNHVLFILTYMLKIVGYNNSYFLTQVDTSSS